MWSIVASGVVFKLNCSLVPRFKFFISHFRAGRRLDSAKLMSAGDQKGYVLNNISGKLTNLVRYCGAPPAGSSPPSPLPNWRVYPPRTQSSSLICCLLFLTVSLVSLLVVGFLITTLLANGTLIECILNIMWFNSHTTFNTHVYLFIDVTNFRLPIKWLNDVSLRSCFLNFRSFPYIPVVRGPRPNENFRVTTFRWEVWCRLIISNLCYSDWSKMLTLRCAVEKKYGVNRHQQNFRLKKIFVAK